MDFKERHLQGIGGIESPFDEASRALRVIKIANGCLDRLGMKALKDGDSAEAALWIEENKQSCLLSPVSNLYLSSMSDKVRIMGAVNSSLNSSRGQVNQSLFHYATVLANVQDKLSSVSEFSLWDLIEGSGCNTPFLIPILSVMDNELVAGLALGWGIRNNYIKFNDQTILVREDGAAW